MKGINYVLSSIFCSLAIGLASPALAQRATNISGGITSVQLNSSFVDALTSLRVTPSALNSSGFAGGTVVFPISGGSIDLSTALLEVIHEGGLSLSVPGVTVDLSNFIITNFSGNTVLLTGTVSANGNLVGRIPLFRLTLPPTLSTPINPGRDGGFTVPEVGVNLTAEAATALNQAFRVTAFREGFGIGTASVRAIAK